MALLAFEVSELLMTSRAMLNKRGKESMVSGIVFEFKSNVWSGLTYRMDRWYGWVFRHSESILLYLFMFSTALGGRVQVQQSGSSLCYFPQLALFIG